MARNRSLARRRPTRDPLPRMLIVCEGAVTEQGYFDDHRRAYRSVLNIEICPGGTPRTLVDRAVKMKRDGELKVKSEGDENQRYDHVWCVFDVDDHPGIQAAADKATGNGIELAISDPCFELWILLHFQDQRAHIKREKLRVAVRKHLPSYEKDVPCDKLRPHYEVAKKRAEDLERWHKEQQRELPSNPSTGIPRLTEQIRRFGKPVT